MTDPIALKALKMAKVPVETIAKTGFVEKLAPAWVALFTDADVNTSAAIAARIPDVEYSTLDMANVKIGDKIPMQFMPSGEVVLNPRATIYAAEPSEATATCDSVYENGHGKNSWTFVFDNNPPIFNDGNGDVYTRIKEVNISDNGAAYKVRFTLDGRHPNATSKDGTLALSMSIFVDAEQYAYDGLTLWSSTEGSTKRFELSVDDSANATLTDVDTGESKGLAGAGSFIVNATVTEMDTSTMEGLCTFDKTFEETRAAILAGQCVICHVSLDGLYMIPAVKCAEDGISFLIFVGAGLTMVTMSNDSSGVIQNVAMG